MTDKQIIIDGVDVSGCPYYIDSKGDCSSHDCECIKCIHNECFYKDYKRKEQECNKLKQTLTEIKEIAENMSNECFYADFDCKYCDMKNGCTYFNKKQILQKISEVENDNKQRKTSKNDK